MATDDGDEMMLVTRPMMLQMRKKTPRTWTPRLRSKQQQQEKTRQHILSRFYLTSGYKMESLLDYVLKYFFGVTYQRFNNKAKVLGLIRINLLSPLE